MTDENYFELQHLARVVELCGFAAEARRTLRELAALERDVPQAAEVMKMVEASLNWTGFEDWVPQVLRDVADRMAVLADPDEEAS
ncbi:MAG: hypothetical protein BGO13_07040 [Burkholderiales bacterium 66-5]|nr:MAG: hypothetical protein BGO13_07040 [Burkholderiales bacterium 66-5]